MFNHIIPEFLVSNVKLSLDFYTNILGFKVEYSRPEDNFYFLSLRKAQIMIIQDPITGVNENSNEWITGKIEYPRGRGLNFQIEVKNLDKIINRAKTRQYELYKDKNEVWRKIRKKEVGEIEFLVQDPDGYLLRFSETIGKRKSNNTPSGSN